MCSAVFPMVFSTTQYPVCVQDKASPAKKIWTFVWIFNFFTSIKQYLITKNMSWSKLKSIVIPSVFLHLKCRCADGKHKRENCLLMAWQAHDMCLLTRWEEEKRRRSLNKQDISCVVTVRRGIGKFIFGGGPRGKCRWHVPSDVLVVSLLKWLSKARFLVEKGTSDRIKNGIFE